MATYNERKLEDLRSTLTNTSAEEPEKIKRIKREIAFLEEELKLDHQIRTRQ